MGLPVNKFICASNRNNVLTDFFKKGGEYNRNRDFFTTTVADIPAEMVQAYRGRIINIHPSLIPSFCGKGYYGMKVHEGVLARGVKVTGATVHFVDEGTDTGPIICQKAVCVKQDDTPKVLQQRVMEEAEWQLLPQAIDWIANGRVQIQDGKVFIK